MLFRIFGRQSLPQSEARNAKHLPASNADAVITIAAELMRRHIIHKLIWSYSSDPTGGKIVATDGGVSKCDFDITSKGAGSINLNLTGSVNSAIVITLTAGGAGITGKIYAEYNSEVG